MKTLEDFKKLPFLTRAELVEAGPFKLMFLPQSEAKVAAVSSGTTNQNTPLVVFRQYLSDFKGPIPIQHIQLKRLYKKFKITRLLDLVPNPNSAMAVGPVFGAFPQCTYKGNVTNLPLTAIASAKLEIEAIRSTTTILAYFIPYLKKHYDLKKIKLITMTGEYCSNQRFVWLKEHFPNAKFNNRFGSIEDLPFGYQCEILPKNNPNIFHWNPGHFPETVEGLLVSTILIKVITPLIRYKTDNTVVFKKSVCICRSNNLLFELLGRTEFDSFRIHGTIIHTQAIEKALNKIRQFILEDYKMHVYEIMKNNNPTVRLVLEIIKREGVSVNIANLRDTVSQNFYLSSKHKLADLVTKGLFEPLQIRFIDSFPKEVKRRRIISHI